MQSYQYNFEGAWFGIYEKVLRLNEELGVRALEKSQLKEVATTIFIASTNKGIIKPYRFSKFQIDIMRLITKVKDKEKQEFIKETLSRLLNNGVKRGEEVL